MSIPIDGTSLVEQRIVRERTKVIGRPRAPPRADARNITDGGLS
jgi:hypothetical protein